MARIELKNLRKEWGSAIAVAGLDLAIEDGAFVAVLGPSGCGKSTTLMMLAGIYQPTERRHHVRRRAGQRRRSARPQRRHRLPVLRALSEHVGARERHVPVALQDGRADRGRAPRAGDRRAGAHRRAARPAAEPALRRPAAARGARPGAGQAARTCCCSTSRCRTSTRGCGSPCAPRSAASSANWA